MIIFHNYSPLSLINFTDSICIIIVLCILVAIFSFILFVWTWERAQAIFSWKPVNIPNDKKEDFLYLKLGWQSAHTEFNLKNKDIYSKSWDWGSLDSSELWRLNKLADRAQHSGSLKDIGLQHTYKGRITYIGTNTGAKSSPTLIMILRAHDDI